MQSEEESRRREVRLGWQPRFGIGSIFAATFVFCVMAAAGSYLMRSLQNGSRPAQLVFILFTLAAPMLLMVAVGILRRVIAWRNRSQRR